MNSALRIVLLTLPVALLAAVALAALVSLTALQHNPQETFMSIETGRIEFSALGLLFASWFAVAFIAVMGLGCASIGFERWVASLLKGRSS